MTTALLFGSGAQAHLSLSFSITETFAILVNCILQQPTLLQKKPESIASSLFWDSILLQMKMEDESKSCVTYLIKY